MSHLWTQTNTWIIHENHGTWFVDTIIHIFLEGHHCISKVNIIASLRYITFLKGNLICGKKTSSHRDPPSPLGAGENGHSGASRVGRGQGGWQHPAYLRHARRCVLHAHWRPGMLGFMGPGCGLNLSDPVPCSSKERSETLFAWQFTSLNSSWRFLESIWRSFTKDLLKSGPGILRAAYPSSTGILLAASQAHGFSICCRIPTPPSVIRSPPALRRVNSSALENRASEGSKPPRNCGMMMDNDNLILDIHLIYKRSNGSMCIYIYSYVYIYLYTLFICIRI